MLSELHEFLCFNPTKDHEQLKLVSICFMAKFLGLGMDTCASLLAARDMKRFRREFNSAYGRVVTFVPTVNSVMDRIYYCGKPAIAEKRFREVMERLAAMSADENSYALRPSQRAALIVSEFSAGGRFGDKKYAAPDSSLAEAVRCIPDVEPLFGSGYL